MQGFFGGEGNFGDEMEVLSYERFNVVILLLNCLGGPGILL